MRTLEYKLVCDDSQHDISETISELLLEGWQLHMGPVIAIGDYKTRFAQALVREADPLWDK